MRQPPYSELKRGTFLIASPEQMEGFFFRSVMLLCEHSQAGSFSLIVNKPIEMELPQEVIKGSEILNPNIQLLAGGPIQPNQMMLLHSSNKIPEQTMPISENIYLGGDLQFLQESLTDPSGPFIRLCFGYCSWAAGQLEREFLAGGWFLHPANSKLLFETKAEKLWKTILQQMGGKYATLSTIPEDLSLN